MFYLQTFVVGLADCTSWLKARISSISTKTEFLPRQEGVINGRYYRDMQEDIDRCFAATASPIFVANGLELIAGCHGCQISAAKSMTQWQHRLSDLDQSNLSPRDLVDTEDDWELGEKCVSP